MSEIIYAIKKKRSAVDGYDNTTKKDVNIDVKIANFIQELVTEVGTCLFDKKYGTSFISDIGDIVNIYKIDYLVKNNYKEAKEKHRVTSLEASNVFIGEKDGFLNITLSVGMDDIVASAKTAVLFSGSLTDKTIIEVEK